MHFILVKSKRKVTKKCEEIYNQIGLTKTWSGHSECLGDIRDFVSNYPEFKKMSGTVSKHVFLIGELSKLVTSAGLLPVSEYEQNLVSGSTEDEKMEELTAILTEQTGLRKEDAERLLGLYFLRKNSHVVAAKLNRLVKGEKKLCKNE